MFRLTIETLFNNLIGRFTYILMKLQARILKKEKKKNKKTHAIAPLGWWRTVLASIKV